MFNILNIMPLFKSRKSTGKFISQAEKHVKRPIKIQV